MLSNKCLIRGQLNQTFLLTRQQFPLGSFTQSWCWQCLYCCISILLMLIVQTYHIIICLLHKICHNSGSNKLSFFFWLLAGIISTQPLYGFGNVQVDPAGFGFLSVSTIQGLVLHPKNLSSFHTLSKHMPAHIMSHISNLRQSSCRPIVCHLLTHCNCFFCSEEYGTLLLAC
jgi:hypothetical protein